MKFFSKRKTNRNGKTSKKVLVVAGVMLALFMAAPVSNNNVVNTVAGSMTTYAAELTQSARWQGTGDRWQVSDNAGGFIKNCWFQDDVTGHWYLLGAEDGSVMYAGLVTDNSTGKTYLLNTNHDGTYGRMLTVDGTYNLNGRSVYLTFNQNHDGTFGAITSGLSEARNAGISESKRDSIPTDSTGSTTSSNNTTSSNSNQQSTQSTQNTDKNKYGQGYNADGTFDWGFGNIDYSNISSGASISDSAAENFLKNR